MLLLHPGFHKTATTWLQEAVFSDRRYFASLLTHDEADRLFVRPHDFDFDPGQAIAVLADKLAKQGRGIPVISSEILSGNILLGSRDSSVIAQRLAASIDEAKVLLTVRAQVPIAQSVYFQYLKRGGRLPVEDYLSFRAEWGYPWFEHGALEFDRLAEHYSGQFGRGNVLVLPQELLRTDRDQYLRLLADFAGVKTPFDTAEIGRRPAVGVSPPVASIPILRGANALRNTTFNPSVDGLVARVGDLVWAAAYRWTFREAEAKKRFAQAVEAAIGGRYAASNARLQAFCPVDLRPLGYEMPAIGSSALGTENGIDTRECSPARLTVSGSV